MRTDANIRRPQLSDLHYLYDIDLKCFDDNLTLDEWREYLGDAGHEILVCMLDDLPVGFVVWHVNDLLRLAVKPACSYLGLGTRLLRAVENILIKRGMRYMSINVPESLCCPDQSLDASGWLLKRGFKATSIHRGGGVFCDNPEDAFVFTKTLAEVPVYGS